MNHSNDRRLKGLISKALIRLQESQSPDGGFASIAGQDAEMSRPAEKLTVFAAALILQCLEKIPSSAEGPKDLIVEKGISFLMSQKSPRWSWNYWQSGSGEAALPDDLDVTSCALSAIEAHRTEIIGGQGLASAVKLLLQAEDREGGPYHTWLVDRAAHPAWAGIDPVVNANIVLFLAMRDVALPNLTGADGLLAEAIDHERFSSLYYFSPVTALYFLSRPYARLKAASERKENIFRQDTARKARELLLKYRKDDQWNNPLETALAISALINFDAKEDQDGDAFRAIERGIAKISSCDEDGRWKAYALYVQRRSKDQEAYSGAPSVTSAFCIEALQAYLDMKKEADQPDECASSEALDLQAGIFEAFSRRFEGAGEIRSDIPKILKRVTEKDPGNQIALLPYFFSKALGDEEADMSLMKELGIANLAGWTAYRIYDDFLDEEGRPELLPCANVCLRMASCDYARLMPESGQDLFRKIMDGMDAANAWERNHTYMPDEGFLEEVCMLPDYGSHESLAHKSLPHCLGPLIILMRKGYGADSVEISRTVSFFHHYILARQLNDDAHDWLSDLERGFVNSAGTKVLEAWRKGSGHAERRSLEEIRSEFQMTFWTETIEVISADIHEHVARAREALSGIHAVKDGRYLESLLLPLERAAKQAISERDSTLAFLDRYAGRS